MSNLKSTDRRRSRKPGRAECRQHSINQSTLRSRKARAIARVTKRDPVRCYRVRLRQSTVDKIIVGLRPAQLDEPLQKILFDAAWDDHFSEVLRQIIEDAVAPKKKP